MQISCRAIYFRHDKILLCKQKNPPRTFWTLPGGSIQAGETLPECLIRELREETGALFTVQQMLFIRELIDMPRHRIEFYFSVMELAKEDASKYLIPQNEIAELRFFSYDEISTNVVRPRCLPMLLKEVLAGKTIFPRYLGEIP